MVRPSSDLKIEYHRTDVSINRYINIYIYFGNLNELCLIDDFKVLDLENKAMLTKGNFKMHE